MRSTSYRELDKCVTRSMGCKLYANEVCLQLTFTVRRALPWPPNKHFYKLANQDIQM